MSAGAIRAGKAVVEASVDDKNFGPKLRMLEAKLKGFGTGVQNIGRRMQGLGRTMMMGGVLAAIPAALSVREFMRFDDAMRAVAGTSRATEQELKQLTESALELGRTTSYTNAEVAGLQLELARAGFSPNEILASTESILSLARATGTELPRAAEIGANVLRGFGLDAAEMARVADVATSATSNSAQNMEEYFEAIKYVAPNAKLAGLSLERTSAMIGRLSDVGIKGSMAGTSLRNAILRLAGPTGEAADLMDQLGVSSRDAAGNLRDPLVVMQELRQAMTAQGFGTADTIAAFQSIFEVRGAAAALVLSESADEVERLNGELTGSIGFADELAKKMDDGIGGAWRRLLSAISGFGTKFGEALSGPLMRVMDGLSFVINKATDFIGQHPEIATMFALLVSGAISAGAALFTAGTALSFIGGAIAMVVTAVSSVMATVAAIGLPVIAIIAGVTAGLALIGATVAAASIATAALVAVFVDWGLVLGQLSGIWTQFIDPIKSGLSYVSEFLKDGQYGKAAESFMLSIGIGLIAGGRQVLESIRPMLSELVRAYVQSFQFLIDQAASFNIAFMKAMITGQGESLSGELMLGPVSALMANAEESMRSRLYSLSEEAALLAIDRADREAWEAVRDEWAAMQDAKGQGALNLSDESQQALAALVEDAEATAARAAENASRARMNFERLGNETAGTWSGQAQLPLTRVIDRQTELLESIDENLDTLASRDPSGMVWGE